MKANELMIGDWVRIKDGFPFKMEDVSGTSMFRRWTSDGETMIPYGWNEIEPIPLTADILNKNFPDTEDGVFWAWDDRKEEENWFEIRIEKDDVDFRMDIRYVHKLQHALRLCGIEKTIEL